MIAVGGGKSSALGHVEKCICFGEEILNFIGDLEEIKGKVSPCAKEKFSESMA
jgi:hypothetical protein